MFVKKAFIVGVENASKIQLLHVANSHLNFDVISFRSYKYFRVFWILNVMLLFIRSKVIIEIVK
jgi:hypothetical protein